MKLLLENFPASLESQRESIKKCLQVMDSVLPLRSVYLFGSHARGDARPDSDVDLCVVSDAAGDQIAASRILSEPLLDVWPRPALTLLPISTSRLKEKMEIGDFFMKPC